MSDPSRYAHVPEYVVRNSGDLKSRELRVLLCLLFHLNRRTGRCDPSRATIAAFTGIEKGNLSKAIAGLKSKGWIDENDDGFSFPEVVKLTTPDGSEKLSNRQPKVVNLTRKVVNLTTRHNINQQRKQRIEQLSIDAIASACQKLHPKTDPKLVELGVVLTLLNRNGSTDRITSFSYFAPEIEKAARDIKKGGMSGRVLDALLRRRREQFEQRHA